MMALHSKGEFRCFCVFQVLLKCFSVLLEIPEVLKQKRPAATTESLQHMVACMTYYLAKVAITYNKLLTR